MKDFSNRLKKIRKKRGLTQSPLAELCNTSRSNIACWENGSRFPSHENLVNLSLQLNIDLNYLCGLCNQLIYNMTLVNPHILSKIDELIKIDIKQRI